MDDKFYSFVLEIGEPWNCLRKIVVEIVPKIIEKNVYEIVYRSPQSYQHYFQCKDDKLWINIK